MRVVAGILIGMFAGLFAVFAFGAAAAGANNHQAAVQAGLGMLLCFGWVGVVGGGALGGVVGLFLSAAVASQRQHIERERADRFRLLEGDLAQAERDLDDRDALIRELRAEIATLRRNARQHGNPAAGD